MPVEACFVMDTEARARLQAPVKLKLMPNLEISGAYRVFGVITNH